MPSHAKIRTRRLIRLLIGDERGVTLVEYGVALAVAVTLGTAGLITLAGEIEQPLNAAGVMMPD